MNNIPHNIFDVPYRDDSRIQILEDLDDLPRARKHQYAAFVREDCSLLVWADSASPVIDDAMDLEKKIIELIWGEGGPIAHPLRTRQPMTKISLPSLHASRVMWKRGAKCSRRSRGSNCIESSISRCSAMSTSSLDASLARCGRRTRTKTPSWCSAPTMVKCSAPTAACTKNGTTPTRKRRTSRWSWRAL